MTEPLHTDRMLTLRGRAADAEVAFRYEPDLQARDDMIADFDLLGLKKLRLEGRLVPDGARDWRIEATLGATAIQPCVVTLAPVTTRIDQPVTRRYLADPGPEPQAGETEIPEDDTVEPLPEAIDLQALFAEALALALPDFPRAPDAALETQVFTEPGKTPLGDDDVKPFAALKALRDNPDASEDD